MILAPFKMIDWYVDEPLELIETPGNILSQLITRGIGISAYTKEGCMGCGGVILWEENVAEAWIRISRKGFKYKKEGIRAIKEGFHIIAETGKDMYIFCWVDTEWPEAQRMVKWLGFIPSSGAGKETREMNNKKYLMWEYDNGNDYHDRWVSNVCGRADTAR